MGFEPMMRVLQTLALPLGHVAVLDERCVILPDPDQMCKGNVPSNSIGFKRNTPFRGY